MDLTWQEILSIAELQGLDIQNDSTYDTSGYGTLATTMPIAGYETGQFPENIAPSINQGIPAYDRNYINTIPVQQQRLPPLPMVPTFGPTAYTGMLISSSITQMGAINQCAPKNLSLNALSSKPTVDHISMPNVSLPSVHLTQQPCKGQDDFESDSGLSLNFSDGESMELENIESQRLHSEYIEMLPSLTYQDQYCLSSAFSEPLTGHTITNTHSYISPRNQELVCGRDERRAAAMSIPFPTERIVNLPVEDFNELLARYTLTEAQLALVRDIRRRGKNKVAAQNCRKRKMENIAILEQDIGQLQTEREGLMQEREEVGKLMEDLKKNLELLQQEVVAVLREQGSHQYQLEDLFHNQTLDGRFFDQHAKEIEELQY
ncbi:transcription factor NF-E2 45 kDa subunit [Discoglossus pictus]